jgi:hypothetical protein
MLLLRHTPNQWPKRVLEGGISIPILSATLARKLSLELIIIAAGRNYNDSTVKILTSEGCLNFSNGQIRVLNFLNFSNHVN